MQSKGCACKVLQSYRMETMTHCLELLASNQRRARRTPFFTAFLAEEGDFSTTEREWPTVLAARPRDPQLHALADSLYRQGAVHAPEKTRSAEVEYRPAIRLAPNIAAYYLALGMSLAGQRRIAEEIAALEKAVILDATDGAAYKLPAELYSRV